MVLRQDFWALQPPMKKRRRQRQLAFCVSSYGTGSLHTVNATHLQPSMMKVSKGFCVSLSPMYAGHEHE